MNLIHIEQIESRAGSHDVADRIHGADFVEVHFVERNVVDLGLIYDVKVNQDAMVDVLITLTTPACPLGPVLVAQIENAVMDLPGVKDVLVDAGQAFFVTGTHLRGARAQLREQLLVGIIEWG